MENQENIKTVQQAVSELIHLDKHRTEIEKKIQKLELRLSNLETSTELRISSLETNMELMLTKSTIVQEISNTVNGNEKEVSEQLKRIKEENEKTSKELKVHETKIENNTLNLEVQRYLIDEMKKKMKEKMNACTVNEEVIKELIKEEFKKKYLQKIKDEIEKNKKENTNPPNTNPMEEQPENNPMEEQPHNVPIISPIEITLDKYQIEQLEEWTNRKVGNVLFDSNIDDWNKNTSVVMNKEHIIIIIEDEEGNQFGGYVNSKIDKVGGFINDSKSFVFSLESNGRIYEMMKFDIILPECAFKIYNQSNYHLFSFGNGGDIDVYKENIKTESYCIQYSFEYEGIENALCGKYNFTPKRIIVIEMI
ncbi:hypothetical protein ENUP19_0053G0002 [Entamoeba nuttalli]|uniref:TLDc domain-containing protein n=1 Tax=Entamoeba nuttalli TaxID=412467 RepID=A0ABQ0DC49_9EUKA